MNQSQQHSVLIVLSYVSLSLLLLFITVLIYVEGIVEYKNQVLSDGKLSVEQRDLLSQNSMAAAAWCMLFVSSIQLVFSVIGVWYVKDTLRHTQETLDLARSAFVAELRPWLSVKLAGISFRKQVNEDGKLYCKCIVRNCGESPAIAFRAYGRIFFLKAEDVLSESVANLGQEISGTVEADGEAVFKEQEVPVYLEMLLTQKDMVEISLDGTKKLCLALMVRYMTKFDKYPGETRVFFRVSNEDNATEGLDLSAPLIAESLNRTFVS